MGSSAVNPFDSVEGPANRDGLSEHISLQTEMIEALSVASNNSELCKIASYYVPRLINIDYCDFYKILSGDQFFLVSQSLAIADEAPPSSCPFPKETLLKEAVVQRKTLIVNDLNTSPLIDDPSEWREEVTATLAAPVFSQDNVYGVISLDRSSGQRFTTKDEYVVHQIAAILSLRFERNHLAQTTKDHLHEILNASRINKYLNEMHADLESVEAEHDLFKITTKWTRLILDSEFASLIQFNLSANQNVVLHEDSGEAPAIFDTDVPLDASSYIELLVHRNTISNNDLSTSTYLDHKLLHSKINAHSDIATPLIVSGKMFGVIHVASQKQDTFNQLCESILFQIATLVSMKIENFKRKKELENHAADLEQANSHLNVTIHNLNERETELRHSLETNKELMGITSHDLKNPLGGIIGLCDILLEDMAKLSGATHDDVLENTELIKKEAEHMLTTIKNLLDKHRQDVKHTFSIQKTELSILLEEVIRWNQSQAQSKGITIHFRSKGDPHYFVDPPSLQRAFDNFLSNAIKYSPQHSNVWVSLEHDAHDGSYWKLSVMDEGPGLSEGDLRRVFKKMQRLSAQPTAGEHSTGLGLYIVKQIVEQHGGTVGVDSIHGQGATFWMLIPHYDKFIDKFDSESAIQA